jgi:hypothetical protein
VFESGSMQLVILENTFDILGARINLFTDISTSFPHTLNHFYLNIPSISFNLGYGALGSEAFLVLGLRSARLDFM